MLELQTGTCNQYTNCNLFLFQYIQQVYDKMKELQPGGSHDVLQFIPMINLYSEWNKSFPIAFPALCNGNIRDQTISS